MPGTTAAIAARIINAAVCLGASRAASLPTAQLVIEVPLLLTSLHSDLIAALSGHSFEEIKEGAKKVHADVVCRFGLNDKGRFKSPWKLHQPIALKFGAALGVLTIV